MISGEKIGTLVGELMDGYMEYAASNPQADYTRLGEYFMGYLQTQDAMDRISRGLQDILDANGGVSVSAEQLAAVVQDIMQGFQ